MNYRNFGSTGLQVSEIVFGGGAVGGLLINAPEATRLAALERAVAAGINWIDTAASYGQGKSEATLGRLLPQLAQTPYLSTKFSIDTESTQSLRDQIEASLTASLERLKRDRVTLLQLHNPIGDTTRGRMLEEDLVLGADGVLDALETLREQGLFEHFGITALGKTPNILRVIQSGRIASAQVYYNLLNPSAGRAMPANYPVYDFSGVLQACADHGVAAMNIRVFSAGVIATDARHGRERPLTPGDSVDSETAKAAHLLPVLGDNYGTRAQTAIRFSLAESRFACIVIGLAELIHLEEAIGAANNGALPDDALAQLPQAYETFSGAEE